MRPRCRTSSATELFASAQRAADSNAAGSMPGAATSAGAKNSGGVPAVAATLSMRATG